MNKFICKEHNQVTWESMDGIMYCADGDGLVTVESSEGKYAVADQGDLVLLTTDEGKAFETANDILKNNYPAVYEELAI